MKKLSIIVPYRDRKSHLDEFIPHMERVLSEQNIDFHIYVVHQNDSKGFNRAKLLNIGFNESNMSDYFAFHDVDMLPVLSDYSYCEIPTHMASEAEQFNFKLPYHEYFGGVTLFNKEDFIRINGYSNDYWGWGAEDDDILLRCKVAKINVGRRKGRYRSLDHKREIERTLYIKNLEKFNSHKGSEVSKISKEGLSNLSYDILNTVSITNRSTMINVKL